MLTIVVPLFGESPALISDMARQMLPDRLILCHTWSKQDSANQNARVLSYYLQSELDMDGEVQVKPLNCSEHPFSLGDSFSNMILRDNALTEHPDEMEYHVLITENTPLGYFFGLTALSGNPIKISCHLGSTSLDISRSHPNEFRPKVTGVQTIQRLPLFEDILEAKAWLKARSGSKRIFELIIRWHDVDRLRYRNRDTFKTITLVDQAASEGNEISQQRVSMQVSNLTKCEQNTRLVERSEESSQNYRLTSIGRTVGWIIQLEE